MKSCCAAMAVISLMGVSAATAAPQASGPSTSAPTLVRIDGQLKTPTGDARTGSVTLVVSLYAEKEDATPLWVEPQVVTLDAAGRYTIFAGATQADGVPQEFLAGATPGRWLGVGVQGEAEQFRMMLVTVPYAAKAREADTLAGKAATDFVLTATLTDTVKAAMKASGVGLAGGSSTNGTGPSVSGTLNVIQKGAGGAAIADATGFVEVGGNVGIGTASPGALLDVTQPTTGATAVFVRNPTAGPGNYARLDLKTDAAGGRGLFDAYSSTFTTSANSVQSGVSFTAIGAGGFSIALQDPAAPMRFYTGPGPSERLRIDNGGNVGIGTNNPNGLQISSAVSETARGMDNVRFGVNLGTPRLILEDATSTQWEIDNFHGRLRIFQPGAEMFTINSSGNVGIGTTTPATRLHVEGGAGTTVYATATIGTAVQGISDSAIGVHGHSGSGTGVYGSSDSGAGVNGYSGSSYGVYGNSVGSYGVVGQSSSSYGVVGLSSSSFGVYGYSGSSFAGYFNGPVSVTGIVCAANISCVSDARLKENVRSLGYGLPQLMRLRPVSWTWIDQTQTQLPIGLIAQEVDGVIPELVLRDADPTKPLGLNYLGFVPVVIKAIQEQQDTIARLRAENAALDTRLTALEQTLLRQQQDQTHPSQVSSDR